MLVQYFREFFFLVGDARRKLPLMLGKFFLISLLDLIGIGLIAPYIGLIISPESQDSRIISYALIFGVPVEENGFILLFGFFLVVLFMVKAIAAILINRSIVSFAQNLGASLRISLMSSYQALSYVDYLRRNSSEYIHAINLAEKFSSSTVQSLLRLMSDGMVALVITILLFFSDPIALGILVFLLGGLVIIYDSIFRPKTLVYGKKFNDYSTQILRSVHEGIDGIKEIRVLGKEDFFLNRLKVGSFGAAEMAVRSAVITNAPRFLLDLLIVVFVVFFVWVAGYLGRSHGDIIQTLSLFGVASIRLAPAANQIITGITKLRFGRHGMHLLYKDLHDLWVRVAEKRDHTCIAGLDRFQFIRLRNINFSYPESPKFALSNICMEVHRGEVIGLMGASGSGKTTLVDLILGLLDPQSGDFFYNDHQVDSSRIAKWRAQVAYLPQQAFLIDDSFKSNIALGETEADIDELRLFEAVKKARLSEVVRALPRGIDTRMGERGARLSGGQKQRLAIARALYYQRDVLIMDESTSALDYKMEKEIVDEINNLKGQVTMIVIAHRLSVLRQCDRIYRLDKGRVVDSGSYDEVVLNTRVEGYN